MFGYVTADRSALTEEQLQRYRGCYCGLCRRIGHTYGMLQRLALNYDLTFLILLLSSLYEPEECNDQHKCAAHPFQTQNSWNNDCTAYAAAMNMILAYHNCLDDWKDDRKVSSRLQAVLFHKGAARAAEQYPRQWQATIRCMETLSAMELDDLQEPDAGANAFGALMEEIFVWKQDRWEPQLRQMGRALGRFIYLLDAVIDLPGDQEKGRYNPLCSRADNSDVKALCLPVLTMYMGECTEAFEQLPLLQDLDTLRNILYSGVWSRFTNHAGEEGTHV